MTSGSRPTVVPDPWAGLARHTPARIALGRSGTSLPTGPHLAFQAAHAQARDAVHRELDAASVADGIAALGVSAITLHSAAVDRQIYLKRPDLGRRLDDASRETLAGRLDADPPDVCLVVADGLSAIAVERHAARTMESLLPQLRAGDRPARLGPVAVVRQGRVAVGDDVGEAMRARLVMILIGERPGLSSPDSLGIYITWAPRIGRLDSERNCISNVRPAGLSYRDAAARAAWLVRAAFERERTGVGLKDESAPPRARVTGSAAFLLAAPTIASSPSDDSPAGEDR